ncbi:MAG TPA: aconitase X catalytic domain-containing protein [Anaerolineales bacterium]|nr:aconitase X catalytic domain-containing protein [Anaerolineales bacterium]
MHLTSEEQQMLAGEHGRAVQKAMEILTALGTIYDAERMVSVTSVQIAGVSFDNLGEAGLEFLSEMADGGGQAKVLTTLNPAGMDIENWQALGIDPEFARNQERVIDAYARMGVLTTCSCTPYFFGNVPHFGEHIAWAESSAVCYANSVLGARTNREGGPSALAAALTGRTPRYGLHLDEHRRPGLTVQVETQLNDTRDFGALGVAVGKAIESRKMKVIPYLRGIPAATVDQLKSFCASAATYGGLSMFHMEGITPESAQFTPPDETLVIAQKDLDEAIHSLDMFPSSEEVDFVSLGCPHLSIDEIQRVAKRLKGRRVRKTFWITTSRPVKRIADQMGYTAVIEAAGAIFAVDTCCVVSPIRGRFKALATDSAKACYYASAKNNFKTRFLPFDEVIEEALR